MISETINIFIANFTTDVISRAEKHLLFERFYRKVCLMRAFEREVFTLFCAYQLWK